MERNENLVHVDGQSLDHGGHGVVDDDLARADVDDDGGQSWRPVEDLTKWSLVNRTGVDNYDHWEDN